MVQREEFRLLEQTEQLIEKIEELQQWIAKVYKELSKEIPEESLVTKHAA
jgi:DNA-binding HxlR family transcriptional regulator